MGKMAGANRNCRGRRDRLGFQSAPEAGELCVGQSMEKRLEKHYGLAEAGVEVIVDGVEQFPFAFRVKGFATCEFFGGGRKTGIEFIDQIGERGNFVQKLGFAGKEHFAQEVVETSHTLAAGILEVCGVERSQIGGGAEMLGVLEHGVE